MVNQKSVILVDNPSEREREKVGVEKWLKNYLEVEDVCYIGRTNILDTGQSAL